MTSDAQRRANAKQDATRKRVALWLEPDDCKALERVMRKQRLPSRISALRYLLASGLPRASGTDSPSGDGNA